MNKFWQTENARKSIERLNRIYDVLVNMAHAPKDDRENFVLNHFADPNRVGETPCREWRFQGSLGFGGKYRSETNTVDCYPEDGNTERRIIIFLTNKELEKIGS